MIRTIVPTTMQVRCFQLSAACAAAFFPQNHKLYPKVNWEQIEAGNYAIVDPVNTGSILYLSEQDYVVMVRVAITSNRTIKVLAAPGETPATASFSSQDPSQNSPKLSPWDLILKLGKRTSEGRKGKNRFLYLFSSKLLSYKSKISASQSTITGSVGISMIGLTRENVCKWFDQWHDIVSWWSRGSLVTTTQEAERKRFGSYLLVILKNNGINHLIARLKIMLFVVNAYLGGRRLDSTASLGFRVKLQKGLPAALPRMVRSGIRYGNKHYIHIWTSMLFSYKGILGTWQEPNLSSGSICNPHPEIHTKSPFLEFVTFANEFWSNVFKSGVSRPNLKVKGTFFSTHAGPNHPVTIFGAGIDAFLWNALDTVAKEVKTSGMELLGPDSWKLTAIQDITGVSRNYIREWLEATDQKEILLEFRKTSKMFALNHELLRGVQDSNNLITVLTGGSSEKPVSDNRYLFRFFGYNTERLRFKSPTLQRLHNLYEAAGKVRTIAIVDYWTNFVLKPFHDWMFQVLTRLPQDATFDQEGRVYEFSQRGYENIYSYDLKSATDLIPLALYRALLGAILPINIIDRWFDLLVNRNFLVPKSTLKAYPDHPNRVRYSTGQPMGALTSWASMALVHHALVLFAAVKAGATHRYKLLNFRDYMVLGDDIVIADKAVAEQYVLLMKELEVPLSIAKSHISDLGMFNFANQTFVKDINVSPVSLREELNTASMPERIELLLRMARRGWMNMESRTWVTPMAKKLVGQDVWYALQPEIRSRVVPPVIRWILATILTPGATRFEFTGLKSISLEIFLGAMLRKGELWGLKMARFGDLIHRIRSKDILVSILGKWVNAVYAQFLLNRKRLEEFPTWVTRVVSVDLEWLFMRVFSDARTDAMHRWTTKYRTVLKTIQVCSNLSRFSIDDIEIGTEMNWNEIVPLVAEAEASMPTVPDFSNENLEALTGLQGRGINSAARDSFMRVTNVLGMIDHLDTSGCPGYKRDSAEIDPKDRL
jgi:hypothetical protein